VPGNARRRNSSYVIKVPAHNSAPRDAVAVAGCGGARRRGQRPGAQPGAAGHAKGPPPAG